MKAFKPTEWHLTIRKQATEKYHKTCYWVVPEFIHILIDKEKFNEAIKALEKQKKLWGDDPEIIRAESLIHFLNGKAVKVYFWNRLWSLPNFFLTN